MRWPIPEMESEDQEDWFSQQITTASIYNQFSKEPMTLFQKQLLVPMWVVSAGHATITLPRCIGRTIFIEQICMVLGKAPGYSFQAFLLVF